MNKSKVITYFHHTIRVLTGILFIFIAGSKFGILPNAVNRPEMFTPEGGAFISAIQASEYLFFAIGIVALLCGLAFLLNRYVAIAAIILVPITLNFVLFHIFLGFSIDSVFHFFRELPPYLLFALNLYILYNERAKYTALFKQ